MLDKKGQQATSPTTPRFASPVKCNPPIRGRRYVILRLEMYGDTSHEDQSSSTPWWLYVHLSGYRFHVGLGLIRNQNTHAINQSYILIVAAYLHRSSFRKIEDLHAAVVPWTVERGSELCPAFSTARGWKGHHNYQIQKDEIRVRLGGRAVDRSRR
jgi:hypothetical protein